MTFRMHSPLHAALPSSPAILIAAISGRSLAAAARRAGYRPLVADLFNDSDTLALAERAVRLPGCLTAGIDGLGISQSLKALAGDEKPVALVYGSGFERKPEIIEALSREFPLAGNSAVAVRSVKDPESLSGLCGELGIPHPEIRFDAPENSNGWLIKLAGGAGGSHVGPAGTPSSSKGNYFQRFVSGVNISALFIAEGGEANIVGFSRQWPSPSPNAPFRYGGAVRLLRFNRKKKRLIEGWLNALANRAGLVGLCSADFVDGPDGLHLIEINPRPGATLDIFDSEHTPLLTQHLHAVRGREPELPAYRGTTASVIAYASHSIANFPALDWPPFTADHQMPGTTLNAGDPVCTVFARAPSAAAAERAAKARVIELSAHWREETQ